MAIHRIRLSKMQKLVNVVALASGIVSTAVIASGVYVYVNRDALIDGVKSQAIEALTGSLGGGLGGSLGGSGIGGSLPIGANDLKSPKNPQTSAPQASAPQASAPQGTSMGLPVPSSAF